MPTTAALNRDVLVAASLAIAVGIVLAIRQWWDRRTRAPAHSDDEARHDRVTDLRRFSVSALLGLIGLLMVASTRIDLQVPAPARRAAARLWGWTWLAVLSLLLVVIGLAFVDWLAGRAFALREASRLIQDHRAFVAEVLARARPEPDEER